MCVCLCLCVCVRVCACVCVCVFLCTCMQFVLFACVQRAMPVSVYMCKHTYIHTGRKEMCCNSNMKPSSKKTCTHTYIHAHMHTYIYTYIQQGNVLQQQYEALIKEKEAFVRQEMQIMAEKHELKKLNEKREEEIQQMQRCVCVCVYT